MLIIDKIAYENRLYHWRAGVKTVIYIALLTMMFVGPIWVQISLSLSIGLITLYVAKLEPLRYIKWLLVPLPFLLISFITIMLTTTPDKSSLLVALPWFSGYLGVSKASLIMAEHLFFRSFGCLICTYFYSMTTPFQQILKVMKWCHLPVVFIELTMLMYRFIFILIEEAQIIYHAQEMRFGHVGLKNSYHSFGLLLKLLFVHIMERYQQMATTLDLKYFQGDFPI